MREGPAFPHEIYIEIGEHLSMEIKIDPELLQTYSAIRLGCLTYRVHVEDRNPALWNFIEETVIPRISRLPDSGSITEMEGIRSSREAYKTFGRSPSHYRVSSESLIRRIYRGKGLYEVNTVVDTNNLVSIETALSVGSYDIARISGPVTLTVGKTGDGYEGIGKDFIDMENMLLVTDDLGPFGSTTSDSRRAMVTKETREVLTLIYCFSESMDIDSILDRASELFSGYAAARDMKKRVVK